jgi:hypothetical protein
MLAQLLGVDGVDSYQCKRIHVLQQLQAAQACNAG